MDLSYLKSIIKSFIFQKSLFFIIPAVILLLLVGISLGFVYQQSFKKEEIVFEEFDESPTSPTLSAQSSQKPIIKVEISGAIINSGVYEMKVGDRVEDLINKAGGFSNSADLEWVAKNLNQAEKLNDGEKIYIYSKEEVRQNQGLDDRGMVSSQKEDGKSSTESLSCPAQININTASQDLLDRCLSGIGPTYAQRIIDYRNQRGGFNNIEEIMNISGIGEKTFAKIKDIIVVN